MIVEIVWPGHQPSFYFNMDQVSIIKFFRKGEGGTPFARVEIYNADGKRINQQFEILMMSEDKRCRVYPSKKRLDFKEVVKLWMKEKNK